ncbi:MAG: signal peptidase I [Arcobacter sp.]|nr:signal peptidase I [Arcobacter sp.]
MLRKIYNWSSSWTGTIIIVLTTIFFIAQPFIIPSGSMKNSLLIGDMLFAKKFVYGIPIPRLPWIEIPLLPDFNGNGHLIEGDKPKRGDIVVFRYPKDEKIHYVKRLVAKGGDIVAMQNKNLLIHFSEGNDYIKENYPKENILKIGDLLWVKNPYKIKHKGIHNDPEVKDDGRHFRQLFDMIPIKIPKGEYFMMGDNRDHSADSRFWGTITYRHIVGTPWFIYLSLDKDKKIRWDRMFKTPKSLEEQIDEKNMKIEHEKGIY